MNFEDNLGFKYQDKSEYIFSKIELVNNLTLKEIEKLNEKYREIGLFIKQVRVDNYGEEKSPDELILQNYVSKKRLLKRHSKMTLEQLYFKYFCFDSFPDKPKKLRSFHNEIRENEKYDNIDLQELKKNLEDIHQDFQQLQSRRCKIDKLEFKKEIIKYIQKFNAYLTTNQYLSIYNKMKEKSMTVIDPTKIDDLSEWTVSLLKEFKAEVEYLAISNIIKRQLGEKVDEEEDKFNIKEEKQKIDEENKEDSSSYSSDY